MIGLSPAGDPRLLRGYFGPSMAAISHLPFMASLRLVPSRVYPDLGAVADASELRRVVGALLTYGLLTSVLMLIVCAAAWAIASSRGSWHAADKAKTGLVVSLAGAVLVGGALAWANWLIGIGNQFQ